MKLWDCEDYDRPVNRIAKPVSCPIKCGAFETAVNTQPAGKTAAQTEIISSFAWLFNQSWKENHPATNHHPHFLAPFVCYFRLFTNEIVISFNNMLIGYCNKTWDWIQIQWGKRSWLEWAINPLMYMYHHRLDVLILPCFAELLSLCFYRGVNDVN